MLTASGFPPGMVTRAGLDWLLDRLLKAQTVDRLKLLGMKEDRRAVISGGGVSVLRAVLAAEHRPHAGRRRARCGTACCDLIDREQERLRSTTVARLYQVRHRLASGRVRIACHCSIAATDARERHAIRTAKLRWSRSAA
jgi:exopolyphosphatase/pppGpp-phosphohydrolase